MEEKELVFVFKRLKTIFKKYENPLTPKLDLDSKYDLWSFKEVVVDGRKRKEIFFASLIIQSRYVGFYFMPVYADTALKSFFQPELLNLLKGKSCFHITRLDDGLVAQIEEALRRGYALYQKRDWI